MIICSVVGGLALESNLAEVNLARLSSGSCTTFVRLISQGDAKIVRKAGFFQPSFRLAVNLPCQAAFLCQAHVYRHRVRCLNLNI